MIAGVIAVVSAGTGLNRYLESATNRNTAMGMASSANVNGKVGKRICAS